MSKVASYLQQHLSGEVLASESAREFFSTDASILRQKPNLVVYPRSTNDIRKVARFTWQLAEKGHVLPVTARGSGTDLSGAAIGRGVILVMPAHLNRILEIDTKQQLVRLQPGVNFKSLQETLNTHGLFLPAYPTSYEYSTVGGAIANNTAGEKSLKYGVMRDYVERLEVVLANGEVIETGPLTKKQLEQKKGLATMEGELYRAVDGLLSDNPDLANKLNLNVSKNSMGYALDQVAAKKGVFDLTPLFVGSQGTLGVISEAILRVEPYSPKTNLIMATFGDFENALDAIDRIVGMQPSALEMIDGRTLDMSRKQRGYLPANRLLSDDDSLPNYVLFIEFDDLKSSTRSKNAKRASKALQGLAERVVASDDYDEQQTIWSIRHSSSAITNYDQSGRAALPIVDDGIVPRQAFHQFIKAIYALFDKYHLEAAVWGHAGDANLHIQPLLDLRKLGDRQKVFKLMDDYHKIVLKLGGSLAAEHNDGRLRAPFNADQYGDEVVQEFEQLKKAFDPYGTLNAGVKVGTDTKQLVDMLRPDYSLAHLSEHLPRT
ncbi:MAG TPA: FAD-binding oxidoreductase [Candidatus Saccharimonadales bacterium]|nr:FAD-binding oxidoreductase [Candidatus Saccharimonadales bacterium]